MLVFIIGLEYVPDDPKEDQRYVYAHYSQTDGESFGTFSEMTVTGLGIRNQLLFSASYSRQSD